MSELEQLAQSSTEATPGTAEPLSATEIVQVQSLPFQPEVQGDCHGWSEVHDPRRCSSPFDLEHLIPSRFSNLALPESEFDDNEDAFISVPTVNAAELTPRPSGNRWVSLPRREAPDRPQWWTEGAGDSGSERDASQAIGPADNFSRGHKAREANRTLDQQSFWETVRDGQP